MSPLPTNPKAIFKVVLESDAGLPKSKQPTFSYRYLTGHQQMELADEMDALEQETSGRSAFEKVFTSAAAGLISWTNISDDNGKAIPFDASKLSHVIGLTEAHELIQKLLSQSLSIQVKKKSVSRSDSNTGQSEAAETVAAEKSAKTNRTKSRR